MNYQLNLESANGRIKRAKTLPYNQMVELKPEIHNNVYIFEILPTSNNLYKMILHSKTGSFIYDKLEEYYLVYGCYSIGIRDKGLNC